MPYKTNTDLPDSVKNGLPTEAQTVFRNVVNQALSNDKSEETAFAYAWAAVKNGYKKENGKWIKKTVDKAEEIVYNNVDLKIDATVAKADETLGLVFGYGIVCKIDGEDYFDLQGDHIPEETMLKALLLFSSNGSVAKAMHSGEQIGSYPFIFPMTEDIAKSLDIQVKKTGALIAMKPDSPEILAKFADGTWTGFSIGGYAKTVENVE
jgi:cation transport regulator